MTFTIELSIIAIAILVTAGILNHRTAQVIRRDALLEGAEALRRRAGTKWEKNPNAALEDEACAQVLERMAGTVPTAPALELREAAA